MSSLEMMFLDSFTLCNTNALKSFLSARKITVDCALDAGWYLVILTVFILI